MFEIKALREINPGEIPVMPNARQIIAAGRSVRAARRARDLDRINQIHEVNLSHAAELARHDRVTSFAKKLVAKFQPVTIGRPNA